MKCINCQKDFFPKDLLTVEVDPKTLAKLTKPGKVCEPCYKLSGIGTLSVLEKGDRIGYRGNPPITSINPRPSAPSEAPADTLPLLIEERDRLKLRIDSSGRGTDFDTSAALKRLGDLNAMIMLRQEPARRTNRGGRLS
jgi:hypothetical protein